MNPPPRVRRRLTRLALAGLAALLLAEGALRLLLFSDVPQLAKLGAGQRQAWRYADSQSEDLYWALRHRFGQLGPAVAPTADALLGWRRTGLVDPETYVHRDLRLVGERRAVLLFGDSYTECATPRKDCWEGLVERSDLAAEFAVVNYGINAFGLDQVTLLLERVLDGFAQAPDFAPPIVVVGVMVDDDLDRTDLRLREWPRPHLRVEGDGLVLEPVTEFDRTAWVEGFDGWPVSYLWRRVSRSRALPPALARRLAPVAGHRERVAARVPLLLDRIQARLEAHGFEACFLLFPGPATLVHRGEPGWQERLLVAELQARGLRHENALMDFLADVHASGREPSEYFGTEGAGADHYDPLGNRVAFGALRRALRPE